MRSRLTIGKFSIYSILISLLVLSLTLCFQGYLCFHFDSRIVIGVTLTINILLYIISIFPIIGMYIAVLLTASSVIYYFFKKETLIKYAIYISKYINGSFTWFIDYLYSKVSLNSQYAGIVVISFVFLLTIFLFFIIVVKHFFMLQLAVGIAITSSMWFFGYEKAFGYTQLYLFISLISYGFTAYVNKENIWKLRKDKYSSKIVFSWVTYTVTAVMLVFLITGFFPGSAKPVNIEWMDNNVFNKVNKLVKYNKDIFSSSYTDGMFNISSMGYQKVSSKLGGAVSISNKPIFKVRIDGSIPYSPYLRGSVKDEYTGDTWIKSQFTSNSLQNGSEITYMDGSTSKINKTDIVTLTVYPGSFKTASIFNIWQPYKVDTNDSSYKCDGSGELYFNKTQSGSDNYKVLSQIPVVYEDELRNAGNAGVSLYINNNMQKYMQVPESIPERVKNLAIQITGKCSNDYDKAEAIQKYLRDNYPYTLNTSTVPYKEDFVDYFLFEEKKGYCTYFASAMAVLSRIAGIPSRYVEGFALQNAEKDENGLYTVTSAMAHAWVELYFDNYGWVRFEPTSSYQLVNYSRPDEENQAPVAGTVDSPPMVTQAPAGQGKGLDLADDMKNKVKVKSSIPWYMYVFILMLIAGVLRPLIKICTAASRIYKADRLHGKEAAIEYMYILEKKLSLCNIKLEDGETPSEFGKRIDAHIQNYDIDIADFVKSYEQIRFGNNEINRDTRKKFKHVIKNADRFVKYKKGTLKYLALKYLL